MSQQTATAAQSDNWKETIMTANVTLNINTFCPLPIWIPTVKDDRDGAWFILTDQLRKLLELPKDFDHEEMLDLDEWSRRPLELGQGENREFQLISESGLYKLILLSDARPVQAFKSWVLHTVAPSLAEDGLFKMGEEAFFHAPEGYDLTQDDIWDEFASDSGSASDLARRYLPELRKWGTAEEGMVCLLDRQPTLLEQNVADAFARKAERQRVPREAA
ncbi:BRO family, N-terminal domain [Tranquillimonas rosea]|uniref:BRO family, N-terminal domain n=1 Tax=Tranquillimonas rosea TaxID=641238 RepID=A0A1H9RUA7_9RHOB|nr:BRO family protein [Tranquillimonas rosea]SER75703.1 BRO family, N-terminal domain [Tranquillimonas rosea]SES33545.1 BRO family, N-terminal domain [Tranquillimonas rosea]